MRKDCNELGQMRWLEERSSITAKGESGARRRAMSMRMAKRSLYNLDYMFLFSLHLEAWLMLFEAWLTWQVVTPDTMVRLATT